MTTTLTWEGSFVAERRAELETQLLELDKELTDTAEIPDFGHNEDDSAQNVEATVEHSSLRIRLFAMRAQVKRALELMAQGSYGICAVCQSKIESARLEAMPTATLCVSCQSKKRR